MWKMIKQCFKRRRGLTAEMEALIETAVDVHVSSICTEVTHNYQHIAALAARVDWLEDELEAMRRQRKRRKLKKGEPADVKND